MAAGSSFRRTVRDSDISFDFPCSPCAIKNRNREATKYCVDCPGYYCSTCVEFHSDIPALSGHKIVGRSEFPTDGSKNLAQLPTERCSKHPTKLVDMYCQNHDQIGCPVCMAVKHRSCIDVFYIPEEIDNILNAEEFKAFEGDFKKARDDLIDLIKSIQEDLDKTNKDKVITLDMIYDFRHNINCRLDELEKITRTTFEEKHEAMQKKLNDALESMNGILMEMDACNQKLQSARETPSQKFISLKKCQEKVTESEEICEEIAKNSTVYIGFVNDDTIMKLLSELQSFGNIIEKANASSLYKVKGRQAYNVSTRSDVMFGSCILTDGTLLLTYHSMNKLKRLDGSTFKVIDECDMSAGPIAVCEISPQEAGVTLSNNTIQLVSLGSKMAPTRSIKMNHNCYGLAVSNGELFVSDNGKNVYVHDTSGTRLRTICKDQSGAYIFFQTKHITVSDDGSRIYVADYYRGVIILYRNGRVLSRYCDPEVSGAWGVCTDSYGNVLVCGYSSNNVLQVGPIDNNIGVIAKQPDGISNPLSVCYDRPTSRMIVTNNISSSITVFNLVKQ